MRWVFKSHIIVEILYVDNTTLLKIKVNSDAIEEQLLVPQRTIQSNGPLKNHLFNTFSQSEELLKEECSLDIKGSSIAYSTFIFTSVCVSV